MVPLDVSPLMVGDELYTITDAGIAACYDAASGKQHWQKRLGGQVLGLARVCRWPDLLPRRGPRRPCWRRAPKFEKLATNKLDGQTQASPAIVDGAIFCAPTRTCIASRESKLARGGLVSIAERSDYT